MRLRKPVGAAQPGEASPVWVASRCFKRQRGEKPHEGSLFRQQSAVGHTSEWSPSP
jgi:hypothetical protein